MRVDCQLTSVGGLVKGWGDSDSGGYVHLDENIRACININLGRSTDITMKAIQNSHERDMRDWEKLFEVADPRFQLLVASQPKGSTLWLLVLQWKGDSVNVISKD
jgi:hypothetical protein